MARSWLLLTTRYICFLLDRVQHLGRKAIMRNNDNNNPHWPTLPPGIRTFVLIVKRISVVLSVADRCEANRERQFYPWYFENRPPEPASNYLRHNVIFFLTYLCKRCEDCSGAGAKIYWNLETWKWLESLTVERLIIHNSYCNFPFVFLRGKLYIWGTSEHHNLSCTKNEYQF